MKTQIVKDIPIGVLLLVLSAYCFYGVSHLSGHPSTLYLFLILLLIHLAFKLIIVGYDLIFGIELKEKK